MAWIKLLTPLDALHSAARIETTNPIDSARPLACVTCAIWSPTKGCADWGRAAVNAPACAATVAGSATSRRA